MILIRPSHIQFTLVFFGMITSVVHAQTTPTYQLDYAHRTLGGATSDVEPYNMVDTMQDAGDDIETQLGGPYLIENVIENDFAKNQIPVLLSGTKIRCSLGEFHPLSDNEEGIVIVRYSQNIKTPTPLKEIQFNPANQLNPNPWTDVEYVDAVQPNTIYIYQFFMQYNDDTLEFLCGYGPIIALSDTRFMDLRDHILCLDCVSAPSAMEFDGNQDGEVNVADILYLDNSTADKLDDKRMLEQ